MLKNRLAVLALGFATILPSVYLLLFFGMFLMFFIRPTGPFGSREGFMVFFAVHAAMILLSFALMATYIIHLFRTTLVPQDGKVLWAIVLFLGGMVAMPVYWFLYLWRPLQRTWEGTSSAQ